MNKFHFIEGLYHFFREDDVSIHFFGIFDDNKLISITDIIHSYDESFDEMGAIKQRIVYLIIEAFQNVIRYSKSNGRLDYFGFRKMEDNYYITTTNTIEQNSIFKLKTTIDSLNALSIDELKEKYKQTLVNREFSERGGAGLGFIEMLRKTRQNIEYFFQDLNASQSLFFFHLKYLTNSQKIYKIDIHKDLYHLFNANNVVLFIKFKYEKQIREILARFCASIVKEKSFLVYHIIVEIIQRISYKANIIDRLLILHEYENNFKLTLLLVIPSDEIVFYLQTLNSIKKLNKDQLNDYFLKLLIEDDTDDTLLSFVEILRRVDDFDFALRQNGQETLFILNCLI